MTNPRLLQDLDAAATQHDSLAAGFKLAGSHDLAQAASMVSLAMRTAAIALQGYHHDVAAAADAERG